MNKIFEKKDLVEKFKSGSSVMIGGFSTCGTAQSLVDLVVESKADNLTMITNDTAWEDTGTAKLIQRKRVSKLIATHIGLNPEAGRQINDGEIEAELIPQGTFVERIRAGGAGLGGILTPTGIGTIVENGKQKITVGNKEYLLETALRADFALIKAHKADEFGNLIFRATARNFNQVMATAADYVIVEAEEIVPVGAIDPQDVMLPGIYVNAIVKGCE